MSLTGLEVIAAIVIAILGSSVVTVVVTKWLNRHVDKAILVRTNHETTDIATQIWERSIKNMATQLELQQRRIFDLEHKLTEAQETIAKLSAHVDTLEARLKIRRQDDI